MTEGKRHKQKRMMIKGEGVIKAREGEISDRVRILEYCRWACCDDRRKDPSSVPEGPSLLSIRYHFVQATQDRRDDSVCQGVLM